MGSYFTQETFRFLDDLARNNDRAWFAANKARYEAHVKAPALALIGDFAPRLAEISRGFAATPRSLYRVHRDTRFQGQEPLQDLRGHTFPARALEGRACSGLLPPRGAR